VPYFASIEMKLCGKLRTWLGINFLKQVRDIIKGLARKRDLNLTEEKKSMPYFGSI
jgi:hypothetical protein